MKVVIDTNILLAIVPKRSKHRWAYDALRNGKYILVISNEILEEYEEILGDYYNADFATVVVEELLNLPNIELVEIYYKFRLIINDPDDDKFADAALVSNSEHIVSHDKHFKVLKNIGFPKLSVLTLSEFKALIEPDEPNIGS
jgi:uncharacterized protein